MKQKIPANFNKAAQSYNGEAYVQKASAQHLISMISDDAAFKSGKILDVGAGTGFATEAIFQQYPNAHFTINDIASNMLNIARQKLKHLPLSISL